MKVSDEHSSIGNASKGADAAELDVRASQVRRMLDAVIEESAARTFANVSVEHIVRRAGVSRKTFYENFDNKLACFLAAYRDGSDELQLCVAQAAGACSGWSSGLRAICTTFAEFHAARPSFARVFFFEIFAAGPDGLAAREQTLAAFVAMYSQFSALAQAERSGAPVVDADTVACAIGAIAELSRVVLDRDGAEALAGQAERFEALSWTIIKGLESVPRGHR